MPAQYSLKPGHRLYSEWKATSYGVFATRRRIHPGLTVNASLHTSYQLLGQLPCQLILCVAFQAGFLDRFRMDHRRRNSWSSGCQHIGSLPRMHLGPVTASKERKSCLSNFRWSWVTSSTSRLLISSCSGNLQQQVSSHPGQIVR